MQSSSFQDSLNAAYRYLSYRPRSEAEIRLFLRRRGFDDELVKKTLIRLREQELTDDVAFAKFWKDNRISFRPKSKRLIQKELRDKKVSADIVDQVTMDIDDDAIAYKLGSDRMPSLGSLEFREFHRRLSGYLGYRGFSHEVVRRTVTRLWRELEREESLA
ncbi:MAG: regulatory protein RecX [Dehalococcoidia bacterium]